MQCSHGDRIIRGISASYPQPKNPAFTKSYSPPRSQSIMFCGLMSRWTSPWPCASRRDVHTCRKMWNPPDLPGSGPSRKEPFAGFNPGSLPVAVVRTDSARRAPKIVRADCVGVSQQADCLDLFQNAVWPPEAFPRRVKALTAVSLRSNACRMEINLAGALSSICLDAYAMTQLALARGQRHGSRHSVSPTKHSVPNSAKNALLTILNEANASSHLPL